MIVQVKYVPVWHHGGVQTDIDQPVWVRSSRCTGGTCVEVAQVNDRVLLRDGKNPDRATISATSIVWADFITGIRNGDFDL